MSILHKNSKATLQKKYFLLIALVASVISVAVFTQPTSAKIYNVETVLKRIYNLSEFPSDKHTPQSYSIKGEAEHAGLKGTFATAYHKTRGYITNLDVDIFTVSQGFEKINGKNIGWQSNLNRIVSDITRLNEDLLVLARVIESKEYLSAPINSLTRECLGPSEFQNRGVYQFRLTNPNGITAEIFIDSLNGELLGLQMQYDFVDAEVIFSDFRIIDGFSFAFHTALTANRTEMNITTQITSCQVNQPLPENTFSRPTTDNLNVTFPPNTDSLIVPLEYHRGHLYFKMSINGSEPRLFMLDSGAGAHVIDAYRVETLGLNPVGAQPGMGIAGTAEFQFASVTEMNLAGILFKNQKVGVLDFGTGMRNSFQGIVGIIGYDFLSHFVVTVDYNREHMIIYPASKDLTSTPNSKAAIKAILPLEFFSNIPLTTAKVNDNPGAFVLDAGSSYGPLLHKAFVEENNLEDLPKLKNYRGNTSIGGVGGSLPIKAVSIETFEIANLIIKNQPARAILGSAGAASSKVIDGNIGNGFLDQFIVTFDYPHRRIILSDYSPN